jgi:putative two-component system response regulator
MQRYQNTQLLGYRILVVDDEAPNIDVLSRLLMRAGYRHVHATTDSREGLRYLAESPPDLILLDLHMPQLDGFQFMAKVREDLADDSYLPILVLTGDHDQDTRSRALSAGATDFLTKPFDTIEVLLRIRNLLETRNLHLRLQRQNEDLEVKVRARTHALEEAQLEILERLALAAEYRDDVTGQHAQRVGALSELLGLELGMDPKDANLLRHAAPLHDVGKIGIPDAILLKAGRLTSAETAVMRTHVAIGARILGGSHFDLLRLAREVALFHHERWDGGGYAGLKSEEIPLPGRIVAVADVFDSLSHERPYKGAMSISDVIRTIEDGVGTQFDPDVVAAFRRLLDGGVLKEHGLA